MATSRRTSQSSDLSDLVGMIYDVALAPQELPNLLSRLTQLCGGSWSPMGMMPLNGGRSIVLQNADADPDHLGLFHSKYLRSETNPSIPLLLSSQPGEILPRERFFSDADWEQRDIYQEIFRPIGVYAAFSAVLLRTKHHFIPLGMQRPKNWGAFETHHVEIFSRAIPHLKRMMQIMLRLNDAELRSTASAQLWDQLPHGMLLLDETARIVWANVFAERLLKNSDGLTAKERCLQAIERNENSALQRLIRMSIETSLGRGSAAGGTLTLSRRLGARPLAALVAPFRIDNGPALVLRRPAAVVFISDPARDPPVPKDLLAQQYGFTPRESALAALLLENLDLQEASDRLGVSINTVRTHLRQLLTKSGTRRQAELVSLLLRTIFTLSQDGRDC